MKKESIIKLMLVFAVLSLVTASVCIAQPSTPGNPGIQPGDQPGIQPGDQPGIQPGDQPGIQPGDQDHGKPDDHGKDRDKGTIIVTVLGTNGRPASGASVSMDGSNVGSTNHNGMLTIRNVRPGNHRISATKNSMRGNGQVSVRGGRTIQTSIQLRRGR